MRPSTPVGPGAFSQLDLLHSSDSQHPHVNGYIDDSDVLAELMFGALASFRSGVELAQRSIKAILPTQIRH